MEIHLESAAPKSLLPFKLSNNSLLSKSRLCYQYEFNTGRVNITISTNMFANLNYQTVSTGKLICNKQSL